LLGEGGSGRESSPTDFVPPEFVALHQPKIEEASNRQRRKRASPDDPPRPALDVQDLTGDKQTHINVDQTQHNCKPSRSESHMHAQCKHADRHICLDRPFGHAH